MTVGRIGELQEQRINDQAWVLEQRELILEREEQLKDVETGMKSYVSTVTQRWSSTLTKR